MKVLIAPLNRDEAPLEIDLAKNATIATLKEKILEKLFPIFAIKSGQLEVKLQYLSESITSLKRIRDGTIIIAEIWRSERVW